MTYKLSRQKLSPSGKAQGFTLIEILIAMTIFAVAATGIYNVTQQTTQNMFKLEQKTIGQWVAANKMAELRSVGTWPPIGRGDETVEMANRRWKIETEVKKQSDELRRVDIYVSLEPEEFGAEAQRVVALSSFFGEY